MIRQVPHVVDLETGRFFMRIGFGSEVGASLEEIEAGFSRRRRAVRHDLRLLDKGLIIEQDVAPVTHAQNAADYVSIGRDVEAPVLASAIHAHIHHRVFLNGDRKVVFPASPGGYASERMG